jgi:hypothetical protein
MYQFTYTHQSNSYKNYTERKHNIQDSFFCEVGKDPIGKWYTVVFKIVGKVYVLILVCKLIIFLFFMLNKYVLYIPLNMIFIKLTFQKSSKT